MFEWNTLPVQRIPLGMLVWQEQPNMDTVRNMLICPCMEHIHVETLCTGMYYVHEGRARAMAAYMRGATHIDAHVLDHYAPPPMDTAPHMDDQPTSTCDCVNAPEGDPACTWCNKRDNPTDLPQGQGE